MSSVGLYLKCGEGKSRWSRSNKELATDIRCTQSREVIDLTILLWGRRTADCYTINCFRLPHRLRQADVIVCNPRTLSIIPQSASTIASIKSKTNTYTKHWELDKPVSTFYMCLY